MPNVSDLSNVSDMTGKILLQEDISPSLRPSAVVPLRSEKPHSAIDINRSRPAETSKFAPRPLTRDWIICSRWINRSRSAEASELAFALAYSRFSADPEQAPYCACLIANLDNLLTFGRPGASSVCALLIANFSKAVFDILPFSSEMRRVFGGKSAAEDFKRFSRRQENPKRKAFPPSGGISLPATPRHAEETPGRVVPADIFLSFCHSVPARLSAPNRSPRGS